MDFSDPIRRPRLARWEPNADVVIDEAARSVVVRVELAGADPDSLRAFVDERHLMIAGSRAQSARLRSGTLVQKEIADGEFYKRLLLPVSVEYGQVTATYADGMLTIALPIAAHEYLPVPHTEIQVIVKRVLV